MSEIVITPTDAQYYRLVADLEVLRERGAESNTAAILEAVAEAAQDARRRDRVNGTNQKAGRRRNAPGPASGGIGPDA